MFPLLLAVLTAPTPPHVVIVLADDLGPGDLGANTPRLTRMAAEGTRFTRYYAAAPICSPSRCGLLTGQFPGRWKLTSYLQTRAGNKSCEQADFLDPAAPSLPRALKSAGYATLHVGKWHLGGGRDVAAPPKFPAYGYDRGLGTWESPEPHPDLTAADWIWSDKDKVKRWDRSRWMVDQTLDFLKSSGGKPGFVNLWLDDPHTPWVPTAADQNTGKGGKTVGRENTRERLAGVMAELDTQVGRLLDGVKALDRPTLVLFLSDNGPLPSFARSRTGGLRGSKLSLYEGGIRVPGIAWGPGLVPAGKTNDRTVLTGVDIAPTLAAVCGATLPAGDGEDLSAALRDEQPVRAKPIFWEYGRNATAFAYPPVPADRSPNLAVRDGSLKLLVNADGSGAELYDLAADPNEATDLAKTRPADTKRLTELVRAWRKTLP